METLKRVKKPGRMRWIKPGSIVSDEIGGFAFVFAPAKHNPGIVTFRRKLPRVTQQIFQGDSQETGITFRRESRRNHNSNLSARLTVAKLGNDFSSQHTQIDRL